MSTDGIDQKKLRELAMKKATASMATTTAQLEELRELVGILMEKKAPLYEQRKMAIARGDVKTCERLNQELRAVSEEISEVNRTAYSLVEADKATVNRMLEDDHDS